MGSNTRILLQPTAEAVGADGLLGAVRRLIALTKVVGEDDLLTDSLIPLAEHIFLEDDDAPRRALLDAARRNRRLSDILLDRVLPGVARRIGTAWEDDSMSFVDVTIVSTRVQDAVRLLGRFALPASDADSLMVIVPRWEQHTLPAAFLSDRFRKLGAPTRLVGGLAVPELARAIARAAPSALMITSGSYWSLDLMRDLIRDLRRAVPRAIPIVVGGPALHMDETGGRSVGADLATNDLLAALRYCDFPLCAIDGSAAPVSA